MIEAFVCCAICSVGVVSFQKHYLLKEPRLVVEPCGICNFVICVLIYCTSATDGLYTSFLSIHQSQWQWLYQEPIPGRLDSIRKHTAAVAPLLVILANTYRTDGLLFFTMLTSIRRLDNGLPYLCNCTMIEKTHQVKKL